MSLLSEVEATILSIKHARSMTVVLFPQFLVTEVICSRSVMAAAPHSLKAQNLNAPKNLERGITLDLSLMSAQARRTIEEHVCSIGDVQGLWMHTISRGHYCRVTMFELVVDYHANRPDDPRELGAFRGSMFGGKYYSRTFKSGCLWMCI
jgi:hypothetical protein